MAVLLTLTALPLRASKQDAISKAYRATALLTHEGTDFNSVCTAWNVAKTSDGYELLTAAHCVDHGDVLPEQLLHGTVKFSVTYDDPSDKEEWLPVTITAVGNPEDPRYDVAVLRVVTNRKLPILEISKDNKAELFDQVFTVSGPSGGYIKRVSTGYVAQPNILYPPGTGDKLFCMPGVGGGSSGAAVLSAKTGKVISMLNYQGDADLDSTGVSAQDIRTFLGVTASATR